MSKETATRLFLDYIKDIFEEVEINQVDEREDGFLFHFTEKGDEFPVDYPVVFVNKSTGNIKELSYLNPEDSKIILGESYGKEEP